MKLDQEDLALTPTTADVIRTFNDAFLEHDASALPELVANDCVMESIEPAPDGTRYEGYANCVTFWQALANDTTTYFEVEDVVVTGDRAVIRWRYHFGDGVDGSVRGVNLMQVRDGKIVEALGYAKSGERRVADALATSSETVQ
jgi:ketosteroid isomerase-like protein